MLLENWLTRTPLDLLLLGWLSECSVQTEWSGADTAKWVGLRLLQQSSSTVAFQG